MVSMTTDSSHSFIMKDSFGHSSTFLLRERLCTHEIFIVDQKKSYSFHNYQKFSIKSYVVVIY